MKLNKVVLPVGDLWQLLREHAAWLNHEKNMIWRRYASSLTAVFIYFGAVSLRNDGPLPMANVFISFLGMIICIIWLIQTLYGWKLQDRRLKIVSDIQKEINQDSINRWPLAFTVGNGQKHDWIKRLAISIIIMFIISFIFLAVNVEWAMPTLH